MNENERLIHRVADAFNSGRFDELDDVLAAGLSAFKHSLEDYKRAFPDAHFEVIDILSSEDKVVDRYTIRGTQTEPFRGIAPTGREVVVTGISIVRVAKGKIVERWGIVDELGLLQQLGFKLVHRGDDGRCV